jgi:hypothetical protein
MHDENTRPRLPFDLDAAVARVVEGESSETDWREIAASATHDPLVWRRVNDALAAARSLDVAMHDVATRADRVELPRSERCEAERHAPAPRRWRLAPWSGWIAAAAVLALAVFVQPLRRGSGEEPSPVARSGGDGAPLIVTASRSAEDAYREYLRLGTDQGRILEELPAITLEAVPDENGGLRVLFVRRLIEQRTVAGDDVFKVVADEHGRPVPLPASPPSPPTRHSI